MTAGMGCRKPQGATLRAGESASSKQMNELNHILLLLFAAMSKNLMLKCCTKATSHSRLFCCAENQRRIRITESEIWYNTVDIAYKNVFFLIGSGTTIIRSLTLGVLLHKCQQWQLQFKDVNQHRWSPQSLPRWICEDGTPVSFMLSLGKFLTCKSVDCGHRLSVYNSQGWIYHHCSHQFAVACVYVQTLRDVWLSSLIRCARKMMNK